MLKIKLSRTGKKNQASFRIVVLEDRSKVNGKVNDLIGHYIPGPKPLIQIDQSKYINWLKKGAQPTNTVRCLYQKHFKS